MSEWIARRFWTTTDVTSHNGGGFVVTLDGRRLRTPGKAELVLPARELAELIAVEWQAQEDRIDPRTMPMTRMANSAVDKVSVQRAEVADIVAAYGETDLLCYRAEGPDELVARQIVGWNPVLDWASTALDASLRTATGLMPVAQDAAAVAALRTRVHAMDSFALTGFHDLVSISGSLILGFAVALGQQSPEEVWAISRIDEDWQAEQWGDDEEAAEAAALRRTAFLDAARFYRLSQLQNEP